MSIRKTKLAVALGAVLGSTVVAPSAYAVNLATDGLGDALITQYYTVRNGYNTLFNLTNTDGVNTIVVKVRFHEGYNSRDVFDFLIVLSPNDVWTGYITLENGVPVMKTDDKSCTVPTITPGGPGQPFVGSGANALLAYTGDAADGGPTGTDRLLEGYVTFTQMGAGNDTVLADAAIHEGPDGSDNPGDNDGVPADCAAINAAFGTGTQAGLEDLYEGFPLYAPNVLKGNWTLANAAGGLTTAGDMVTLANFYEGDSTATPPNLMTLQMPPDAINLGSDQANFRASFHEPTLHSANTPGEVLQADGSLAATRARTPAGGADAVSLTMARSSIINLWSRRISPVTGWGTQTDWIITFPTKRFYSDRDNNIWAGRAQYRANLDNLADGLRDEASTIAAPFNEAFTTTAGNNDGLACDPFRAYVYDREEYSPSTPGGPVFSPAPTPEGDSICYEVNVVTFENGNVVGSTLLSNLTSLPAGNGWMRMDLGNTASNAGTGLPVVGYAIVTRSTGQTALNDSVTIGHAYERNLQDPPYQIVDPTPVP